MSDGRIEGEAISWALREYPYDSHERTAAEAGFIAGVEAAVPGVFDWIFRKLYPNAPEKSIKGMIEHYHADYQKANQ